MLADYARGMDTSFFVIEKGTIIKTVSSAAPTSGGTAGR